MHLFGSKKRNSLVAFFLAVVTVLGLIQFNVFAAGYENPYITSGDWTYYYSESENRAIIISYKGKGENVTVPGTLGGYPVELNMEAMYDCNAKTITVSSGVVAIGSHCFADCRNLNKVTIPASVKELGYAAFNNCPNLVSVTLGSGITQIQWATFENCTSLTSISLPSGIQVIGEKAFRNCTSLSAFSFTNKITEIGANAFEGCSKLNSVTLPSSVLNIGNSAFKDCSSLSSVNANFGNYANLNVGAGILDGTAYYNNASNWKNDCLVVSGCLVSVSQKNEISLPSGIFAIASGVFGNDYAVKVTLSESVVKICDGAFDNASSLRAIEVSPSNKNYSSVEGILVRKSDSALLIYPSGKIENVCSIPSAIKKISANAFEGNLYVRNLSLNAVTTIEEFAFKGCTSLMSVDFGSAVKTIGENAFEGCTGLMVVVIPSSVTTLGASVFKNCVSLERAVIPNNLKSIPLGMFDGCSSLKSATIGANVKSIGQYAFYGCEALESITIPDNVESIGYYSFGGCKSLKTITTCADIDESAFSGCTALETLTLKEGNEVISNNAFDGCTALSSVKFPETLKSIGACAFLGCTSLKKLTILGNVTDINSNYAFGYKYVNGSYEKITSLVVYGYNYSSAEYYCNDKGIAFVSMDLPSPGEIILDYSKGVFYLYGEKATPSHVSAFLKSDSDMDASFTRADGSAIPSGKYIGTGCKVKLGTRNLTVVIKGDTTGDGLINTSDYIQVKKSFLKTYTFDEWAAMAAEVQENGRIDATDYIRIKLHFLGSLNIFDMEE